MNDDITGIGGYNDSPAVWGDVGWIEEKFEDALLQITALKNENTRLNEV